MSTKVTNSMRSPIPAGIFSGIEAFYHNDEKWVIANGITQRFHESPSSVQQPIWKAFMADKQSLAYLAKMGITKASEAFDMWYKCVIGGLDHIPDLLNGKLIPDAYNNMCTESNCPHRGRLCSRAIGLKNYEVETIHSLMQGKSLEQTAKSLFLSVPAIKSRVSKLHEKFDVKNTVALIAMATELGV